MNMIQRFVEIFIHLIRYGYFLVRFGFRNLEFPVAIENGVEIGMPKMIFIGKYSHLGKDVWLNALPNTDKKINIVIGKYTDIGRRTTITSAKSIRIGDKVLIGPNCFITDHNHGYENLEEAPLDQGVTNIRPVLIGEHVWIGTNSIILPGVVLGKHVVIGANSVVNMNIPDFCVAVGSPAKIVRRYDPKLKKWISV